MAWFRKIPWPSLILLILVYGVFGWLYTPWFELFLEGGELFGWIIEKNIAFVLVYGLGCLWVLLISTVFTAPVTLMTFSMSKWLKSEVRAFLSVIFGALAFALVIRWFAFFTRLFVLLAAAMLVKLDLQAAGYSRWLSALILALVCLTAFSIGVLAFYAWK
ncbi:hypothetical protein IQ238_16500 [Pleurocapsales cyanobacterium LEGE 06147]|nr:hypothetical protein [Pleurocapsales cyanobacterium LEGE 06147]